ncbi:UDP-forming cellulose synthase catalytic subunit [Oleisolibacter albus]|uniref:UDP-forming cellulose synthase catalytic subunit n=1 Tax=Oleisolibacter albus TaxID=2171757 RepID=UPI000DF28266|nr:UDP-forming cellulose synthase catalytic subunit [Oleisolibacter albus]
MRSTSAAPSWLSDNPGQASLLFALGLLLAVPAVTVPLSLAAQALLSLAAVILLMLYRGGRRWIILMMAVSVLFSSRYLWWRISTTMVADDPLQGVLGTGLLLAEIYAWLVMVLGYVQCAWPLGRKPVPMPADMAQWPHVDVFIPTYNESLDIVRNTVWAALDMDWPRDRLHVHLLDDGRRPELRAFADRFGINYITRGDNRYAKAGNLNNALSKTQGEFIAVFDCDHVPNRAFLQMTMGGFVNDPRLALVQTPHHFYSPDPVQRNLKNGGRLANEGLLFYGLVQDGNDLWDAAFFCGSCAVLRRSALEEIGGFAIETLTEDAHTALRLHQRGWHSAYLRLPLAAGLATETLAAHLKQRLRWACGMHQVFRIDNPLLCPGLSLPQRLCYINAMLHFFFPLPRIVVLTAPLAFLLLNVNVMAANALEVVGYAAPHLLLAVLTNQRIQGHLRGPFWGEIYETILSFHLLIPTTITLFKPGRGQFNVTSKGGLLSQGFFDSRSVRPQVLVMLLLLAGYGYGLYVWLSGDLPSDQIGVLLINLFWALFNIVILGAAAAVGLEKRQARKHVRIGMRLPLSIHFPDGRVLAGTANDISMGGANLSLDTREPTAPAGTEVQVEFDLRGRPLFLPARIAGNGAGATRLAFSDLDEEQTRQLVLATFGRADAWLDWDQVETSGLSRSIRRILSSFLAFLVHGLRTPGRRIAGPVAVLLLLGLTWSVLPAAAATKDPVPVLASPPAAAPAPLPGNSRAEITPLSELTAQDALTLRGVTDRRSFYFTIRKDEVPTAASLNFSLGNSPALLQQLSHLKVSVNDEVVGTITLAPETAAGQTVTLPINPLVLRPENRVDLEFVGHYTMSCEDPRHSSLWATVNASSTLNVSLQRLPLVPDLAMLPRPFFDTNDRRPLTLPFVLGAAPSDSVVRAAGIVASWFGLLADYRPAHFPAYGDQLPDDNAVIVATPETAPAGLDIGPVAGPTLAVITNPISPSHRLLLVLGRTEEELAAAAQVLALGSGGLTGNRASVHAPLLAARQPYDAPRWIPSGRSIRLGELVAPADLQAAGLTPAPLRVTFGMAPDLFVWRNKGLPMTVRYRYPGDNWIDLAHSRLDVSMNGVYVNSLRLREDWITDWFRSQLLGDYQQRERKVQLPPYLFYGRNRLEFYYALHPVDRGECQPTLPENLRTVIDPDSEIDLSGAVHFTAMPNLAHLTGAGFPFTRMADLGETVMVLPDRPEPADLEAALDLFGLTGAATGFPATRVQVRRANAGDAQLRDRDIIIIGDFARQPLLQRWGQQAPVKQAGGVLALNTLSPLYRLYTILDDELEAAGMGEPAEAERALIDQAGGLGILMSFESPVTAGRTVVAVTGTGAATLPRLTAALRQPALADHFQGDLVIMNGGDLRSFRIGPRYWVGSLPRWIWIQHVLSRHSGLVLLGTLLGLVLITVGATRLLQRRARQRLAATNGVESRRA